MNLNFDNNQNHYFYRNKNTIPLVFIHGVGLSKSMWKPPVDFFENYSVLTYDLLGHGKTPFSKDNLTISDFSNQLIELLNYLKLKKIDLIGFSIGSLIALDFSSKNQQYLNSLTLIGSTYMRTEDERKKVIDRVNLAKENRSISKLAMKRWFSDEYLNNNPELHKKFIQELEKKGNDHANFIKAYSLFAYYEDDLNIVKNIPTKTLVLTGELDPGSTPKMSKKLCSDMINANYVEIKNGKHLCSIECADDVNFAIKKHIDNA